MQMLHFLQERCVPSQAGEKLEKEVSVCGEGRHKGLYWEENYKLKTARIHVAGISIIRLSIFSNKWVWSLESVACNKIFLLSLGVVSLQGVGTLQQVQVPIIDYTACQQMLQIQATDDFKLNQDMLCAGYQEGGKDSCQVNACMQDFA